MKLYVAYIVFLFLLLFRSLIANGQCSGTLGYNIFSDGDFGGGNENIINYDPLIAPGYIYETSPPPNDGEYTITNNTGLWPDLFVSWHETMDNSNSDNGYMMVVNASYEPGLFYKQIVDNLCENTQYEFSADIVNMIEVGISGAISPNIDFLLNGEILLQTGDIPQDEQWHTYKAEYITADNETSLELALRNNAPGGYGNDLALDNISFEPCGPITNILPNGSLSVCLEDSATISAFYENTPYDEHYIQWQYSSNNIDWVNIGTPTLDSLLTISPSTLSYYRFIIGSSPLNVENINCYMISDPKTAEVIQSESLFIDLLVCEDESVFLPDGTEINEEVSEYENIILDQYGCDSLKINYDIIKVSSENVFKDTLVCEEKGITLENGRFLSSSGVYELSYEGTEGCDSLVTLNLETFKCSNCTIFPTAFSPNNDGINDTFGVITSCDINNYTLKIFNRWGQLVYISKDIYSQWDGTIKNNSLPMGVYVWFCSYDVGNIEESRKGNVTIIK